MSFESEVARLYENEGRSWEAIPRKQLGWITKVVIIKNVGVVSFIFDFFSWYFISSFPEGLSRNND